MQDTPSATTDATGDELRADGPAFVCLPDWVVDRFSPVEVVVWTVIERHADRRTGRCWPSVERIAELARVSESTAHRAIAALRKGGALRVARRAQQSNVYQTVWNEPRLDAPDGVTHDTPSTAVDQSLVTPEPEPVKGSTTTPEPLFPRPAVSSTADLAPARARVRPVGTPEVQRLCGVLAELVKANGGRPRITPQTWLGPVDRLLRVDGCPPEEVERVIRWARSDRFWCGVIVNGQQLRRHYAKLLDKANQAQASSPEALIARVRERQASGESLLPPGVQAMLDKRAAAQRG